jgi:cytochrome c2
LALYIDLGKNKPPKGSNEAWKKRTDALVAATKAVIDDKPDGAKALKAAANCKACHSMHKAD